MGSKSADTIYDLARRWQTLDAWDIVRLAMACADTRIAERGLGDVLAVTSLLDEHAPVLMVGPRRGSGRAAAIDDLCPTEMAELARTGEQKALLVLWGAYAASVMAVEAIARAHTPRVPVLERVRRLVTGRR